MHDFHLADQIYKTILEYAEKNRLRKVKRAVIELGSIVEHGEEVLPDNLKFNIIMLAKSGVADNLELEIVRTQNDHWALKEIEGE